MNMAIATPYYAPYTQPYYNQYQPQRYDWQLQQQMQNYQQMLANQPAQQQGSQTQQQVQQAPQSSSIIWVSGEAGAKSYLVAPNNTVMLMDAENSTFYLKSTDASGMPLPIRIFDYQERTGQPQTADTPQKAEYITRDEFEDRLSSLSQPQTQNITKKDKDGTKNG